MSAVRVAFSPSLSRTATRVFILLLTFLLGFFSVADWIIKVNSAVVDSIVGFGGVFGCLSLVICCLGLLRRTI